MTHHRLTSSALILFSLAVLPGNHARPAQAASAAPHPKAIPTHSAFGVTAPVQGSAVFTANRGQWPDSILFRTEAGGATIWLTRTGIYYEFATPIAEPEAAQRTNHMARLGPAAIGDALQHDRYKVDMVKSEFVGADPGVRVLGVDEQGYKCNYFLGSDPARWRSEVPNYSSVVYANLYPGIDLRYNLREGRLEHQMVLKSGADPNQLQFLHEGSTAYTLDPDGNPVATNLPQIPSTEASPMAGGSFPEVGSGGSRARVNLPGPNAATVSVTLSYSTYLGGSDNDDVRSVDVDNSGQACVAGYTQSADFPTLNTIQSYQVGTHDVFVAKLNAAGNALLFSTYLGGTGDDDAIDLAMSASGDVYVTGITTSTDFPTVNPFQAVHGGGDDDGFVVKLSPVGNSVTYATYLGGDSTDIATGIAVDVAGHAYVSGTTYSPDYPVLNPFQTDQPDLDLFITKLDVNGDAVSYSTYLGGNSEDYGDEIAVDGAGSAYVTGVTYSTDFPTQNPFQTDQGVGDAIVTKLSPTGDALDYSTYLGGSDEDASVGVVVDANGNAYVDGYTISTDFPTQDPYQQTPQGNFDAFAAKLNATGDALLYSTYIGGSDFDQAYALALDGLGNAYVAGYTASADFPLQSPYQTNQPGVDAFVLKLGPSGSYVAYSTYLGGNDQDFTIGLAVDDLGSVYMTGTTSSTDFPTQNPFQTYQGASSLKDGFVAKLSDQVTDILKYILYSPVDMVVTDPVGDSIGIGFNTILNGSTYDTLLDVNGDLDPDDSVTIPNPIAGNYRVRIFPEAGAVGSDKFTFAIRIDGNQQLVPDGYKDQSVSALGNTVPDTVVWTEVPTLAGDCDANGTITSADIIYLVNYVFKSGAGPVVSQHGDVNCDGLTTSADIIYLVNYVFKSSISPCSQSAG